MPWTVSNVMYTLEGMLDVAIVDALTSEPGETLVGKLTKRQIRTRPTQTCVLLSCIDVLTSEKEHWLGEEQHIVNVQTS